MNYYFDCPNCKLKWELIFTGDGDESECEKCHKNYRLEYKLVEVKKEGKL